MSKNLLLANVGTKLTGKRLKIIKLIWNAICHILIYPMIVLHDCTNYLCSNVEHLKRIQIYHDELIAACISASSAIPDTSNNNKMYARRTRSFFRNKNAI